MKRIAKKTWFSLIAYSLIKLFYVVLSVRLLENLWYPGTNGFGVAFNSSKLLISIPVFLFVAFLQIRLIEKSNKSAFFKNTLHVLFVLYYIPLNSAFEINDAPISFFVLSNVYYALIIFIAHFIKNKGLLNNFVGNRIDNKMSKIIRYVCFLCCLAYVLYKFSYNGFQFNLSIDSDYVYTGREEYVKYRESFTGSLLSYIVTLVSSITSFVAYLYLYVSLKEKRLFGIVFSLFTVLCMYSVSTGKGHLFTVLIVFCVFLLEKRKWLHLFRPIFDSGLLALFVVSVVEILITGTSKIYFVFVRREMYYPAWLSTMYYDFFSLNPKIMWTSSTFLFQSFLHGPYSQTPLELISENYFQGLAAAPNTGMFADAYMNFGVFGIFIYPVLLIFFISLAEKTFAKIGLTGLPVFFSFAIAADLMNIPLLRTDFVLKYLAGFILILFFSLFVKKKNTNTFSNSNKLVNEYGNTIY